MNIFKKIMNNFDNSGAVRLTDPDTSVDAALSVDATKMEQIVLEAIKGFPNGCISEEIEKALPHIRASSITPRYRPLMKKGLVVDIGERRPGLSGRSQRVMRAV